MIKQTFKIIIVLACALNICFAVDMRAQPQSVVDTVTDAYDPSELSELTGISGFSGITGLYQTHSEGNSDGCTEEDQVCTCSNTKQQGICDIGPVKNGLYCQCGEEQDLFDSSTGPIVPEHHVAAPCHGVESNNFQKVMNYFAPYFGAIALSFAATLAHEMGHNVVNLAVNKQWSKIWIGEHKYTESVLDKDLSLDAINLLDVWIESIRYDNAQGKWVLAVVNNDPLFNNYWISVYKPDEESFFRGFIKMLPIENKYLSATKSLMGPTFGALFSWLMLQSVHQPNLEFTAQKNLFSDLVINIFQKGTDGEKALKALNVPTRWMGSVEQQELSLAASSFDLLNLEHIVDIAMFNKALTAKTEAHRMITLMGQSAFKVMIPVMMNYIKESSNSMIDATKKYWSQFEDRWDEDVVRGAYLLNILTTMLLPAMVIYGIVAQNAKAPFASYLTRYF